MMNYIKRWSFLFIAIFFCGCNSNIEDGWANPLNSREIAILRAAVDKIDSKQVAVYRQKLKLLSSQTLLYSSVDGIRALESYQDIYGWIKNDVKNLPLLFQYIIYGEKQISSEERFNSELLLWHLADELYPSATAKIREEFEFKFDPAILLDDEVSLADYFVDSSIYLIKLLLQEYYENS